MRTDKKTYLQRFRERLRTALQGGVKMDISFLLEEAANLKTPEERVKWLERLLLWVRLAGGVGTTRQTSLKFLLSRLEQNPAWKESSAAAIRQILADGLYSHLFSETGVPSNYVFLREGVARLVRSLFPVPGNPGDMESVLGRVFHDDDDAQWVDSMSPELRAQVEAWLFSSPEFTARVREKVIEEAFEACAVLCVRASAISIQRDVMERAGRTRTGQVPPLRLRWHLEEFFPLLILSRQRADITTSLLLVKQEIASSRKYLEDVRAHLEKFGVSVALVFSLESAAAILNRVETLVDLAVWLRFPEEKFAPWQFFVGLLRDSASEKHVTPLLKSNFHLLSRKIVERTGATGENYITSSRADYLSMFSAAVGGGFITAFTGLAKYLGPHDAAPFLIGCYAALNYSFSFVLMHHLHFKLATKQPAATAAALAERLSGDPETHGLSEFVDLVARISRSQFAAVAGNILAVIPTALAIDQLSYWWYGTHLLGAEEAAHTLATFHPFATLTVFYAALTGVLLWASGLISGWVENAFVYFRVQKALAGHPFLENFLGTARLEGLAAKIPGNLSGWASSVSLAFLLAFVPVAGKFFGLPIDVRHVTLTSGAVSYSASALGWSNLTSDTIVMTILGVALIGAMNFGVSFALAFNIAVRAIKVPRSRVRVILRACVGQLLRRPARFFLP